MGGGASKALPPAVDLSGLPEPVDKGNGNKYYYVIPQGEDLKKKGDRLIMEVGPVGLRLLKESNESPVVQYCWGEIHSWAHTSTKFTFRHFDEGKKTIIPVTVLLRDIPPMLEHVQHTIEAILEQRRSSAISEETFQELMGRMKNGDESMKLEYLRTTSQMNYFSSDQGLQILKLLHTSFDKVEAAVLLHSRLIDQNRFSTMLEDLETQEDRDNVWHRISRLKRQTSSVSPTKP